MTALIFVALDRCQVVIFDSLGACIFYGMQLVHMGRVFCVPAGVAA